MISCQYCGVSTEQTRVMCPNCGRRMRPAGQATGDPPPEHPAPDYPASDYPASDYPASYPSGPEPVALQITPQQVRRRLTVLVRLLLILPHLIYLGLYSVVALVAIVAGWFAALVAGRLPEAISGFVTGWLRYYARVYAYLMLLTDVWPPFSAYAADYPVAVRAPRYRLNRAAVAFRLILLIPAYLVSTVVFYGWGLLSWIFWLVALLAGRSPDGIYQSSYAVLRFQVRYLAYAALLTPAYPRGLFGDRPDHPFPDPATQYGTPLYGTPTVPAAGLRPDGTLLLSTPARIWIVIMLVLGVLFGVSGDFGPRAPNPTNGGGTTTASGFASRR